MCCSNASCFPIVYLSRCDAKVFLTEFTEEVTLNIYKSNSKICEYTLEPDNGELFLTDLEILDFGNLFHKFLQDMLPEKQVEVLIETEHVKGFADIVLPEMVLDIKSQHSQAFWYMEKENTIPITLRKRPDFLQVTWYATQLKKPKCGVVYVSKDDLCMKEYIIPTETLAKELSTELNQLAYIETSGELPKGEPRAYPSYSKGVLSGYKECSYCPFMDKCFELDGKKGGKI